MRILIFLLIIVLCQIYFFRKFNIAISISKRRINSKIIKLIRIIMLFFTNAFLLYLIYGNLLNNSILVQPENLFFEYIINIPFWVCFLIIVQTDIFFIIIDLIKLLLIIISNRLRAKLILYEPSIYSIILIFFVLYVPSRIYYDYKTVEVREVTYYKKNLNPALSDLKLVFISDIHADYFTNTERLNNYIEKVNNLNPDIVLIAGDVITSGNKYINVAAESLGKIKTNYGVYACVGDHDNWAYRYDNDRSVKEVTEALARQNIKMLDDTTLTLKYKNSKLLIAFITNTYVKSIPENKLIKIIQGVDSSDLKIFLTHQPRNFLFQTAQENNYDLFLSGHTHGGQITVLFPFLNLSPTLLETKYVKGDFYFGNMLMIVCRGLGMSIAPVRYNSQPEVILIKLQNK